MHIARQPIFSQTWFGMVTARLSGTYQNRSYPALLAAVLSAAAILAAATFGDAAGIAISPPIATHPTSTGHVVVALIWLHHPSSGSPLSQLLPVDLVPPDTELVRLSS
jgi:hypothetical protein